MSPFWIVTGIISTALLVLLVWTMQRRSYFKLYPSLFLYALTSLLAGVAEWAVVLKVYSLSADDYRTYYWTNEFLLQSLMFLVMLAFIYRAWEGKPRRLALCFGVAGLVVIGTLGSVLASKTSSDPRIVITNLSRNLSFASALLNLLLWTALVKNRSRDRQLLLLATGLGMVTTGKAIGHSLRTLSAATHAVGNATIVFTQLICFGVWLWTLRSVPARDRSGKLVAVPAARDANA